MMTPVFDDTVRPWFARLTTPIGLRLSGLGCGPFAVTWAGFVLALVAAALVARGPAWVALLAWIASRAADGLDGVVARATGRTSAFGGYLDITLDMTAYSLMVIGFAWRHPEHALLWTLVLAGYVVVITTTLALSAAAERAQQALAPGDRTFQFTRGLAEAGETSAVYTLWLLWPAAIAPVGWVWCGMLAVTAVQRSWLAWRHLPASARGPDSGG